MPTEIETKYETDESTPLPGFEGLPGVCSIRGPVSEQLEADYYDTTDLRLLRAGITLRRRTGGPDAGWHLKLPGAGRQRAAVRREEIRLPLGRAGRRVPSELAKLVRAHVRGERLGLVASITTLRDTTTLLGPAGESLAEVADDRVRAAAAADPGAGPSGWREIEVELTGGDRHLLAAADQLLRRAGLRRSDRAAKLERVLGEPAADRPAASGRQPSAADVVTDYLREHADTLVALDPMVRRREPDAVHKMRVATRRLRSTLRSFDTVVSQEDGAQVAAELQWLGSVLGQERDAEVQAGRLREHVRATPADVLLGPVQARIQAHVAKAAASSHAAVVAALNSDRYVALLDALDALIASPKAGPQAGSPARRVLPRAVRRSDRRTRRRMRAALTEPAGPARDTALHAARKAAKRARYAAETAIPVCGPAADRFARQMKKVQSALGDYQDTVVGRQLARRLGVAAHLAGESAFSYGLLYGRDACTAGRLESLAGQTWRRAGRRRYRSWLAGR
jgi:CHAD domain-containing protein